MSLRSARTAQPQGPAQIDWNEPLAKGLLLSLPLAAGTGFQSIGQSRRTGALTAVTSAPTAQGTGAKFVGTGYIDLGAAPILFPGQPFALAFYEEMAATGAYTAFTGLSVGANRFLFIRGTDPNYYCTVGVASGPAARRFASMPAPVIGEKIRFLLTGSNISDSTTYRLWANGVESLSPLTATFSATAATTNYIGWDGADTRFNGVVADYNIWGREFSTADAEAYFDNPHRIYLPTARSLWVPGEVGAGGPATVIPIGVQANSAIGTPAAIGAAIAALTGVSATGSVGSPTATGGASIPATASPSGVSASSAVGTPAAKGAAKALPAGVQATSAVGTPLAIGGSSIPATVLPAGVAGLAYVGSPVATGQARAYPLGVQATGAVGSPVVTAGGSAVAQPQGVAASSSVGAPVARGAAVAYPLGMAGYWSVGQPVAIGQSAMPATAYPAGVSATGYVGTPVAFEASDATPSIHRAISPAQSYTATSPAQSYIATSPAQSYTAVVPAQIYST